MYNFSRSCHVSIHGGPATDAILSFAGNDFGREHAAHGHRAQHDALHEDASDTPGNVDEYGTGAFKSVSTEPMLQCSIEHSANLR